MDDTRFDVLTRRFADPTTRRGTLRLLAGGLLGALLAQRGGALVRAQDLDSDQDGLFDDDEVNIYGTKPDVVDTDGDGVGDGQEICNRDGQDPNCQQDQVHTNPLVNENAAAPPPPADGGGAAPPAATCTPVGGACSTNTCCQTDPNYNYVQCCFDANGAGVCTDVTVDGSFLCPDPGVPATGCAVGMTNCGGFCTNLSTDNGNCGACGHSCPIDSICTTGACIQACPRGDMTVCSGVCVDLLTDIFNCGACGHTCDCPFDTDERCQICNFGVCS